MAHQEPLSSKEDIEALNAIAVKLYQQLAKNSSTSENVVISPPAVFLNLFELYVGSRGKTKEELEDFFGINPQNLQAVLADLKSMMKEGHHMKPDKERHFDLFGGSKLVLGEGAENSLNRSFVDEINNVTECDAVEFAAWEEPLSTLDTLTSGLTREKLAGRDAPPRAVQDSEQKNVQAIAKKLKDSKDGLLLFSAMHFYSEWEAKFVKSVSAIYDRGVGAPENPQSKLLITVDDFHNADGSVVPTLFLHLQEKIFFTRDEDLKVTIAELPLSHYSMNLTIILPDDAKNGLKNFEGNFTADTLNVLRKNWQMPEMHVYLPKFVVEGHNFLSKSLQNLGLKHAFSSSGTEFSGLIGHKAHVVDAVHVAGIEISAEVGEPLPPYKPQAGQCSGIMKLPEFARAFHVNRPFIFFVTNHHPEIWCMMGKVVNLAPEFDLQVRRHHKRREEHSY